MKSKDIHPLSQSLHQALRLSPHSKVRVDETDQGWTVYLSRTGLDPLTIELTWAGIAEAVAGTTRGWGPEIGKRIARYQ